ncbi:hypothetical protein MS3_00003674 [Schistosoma haematobium]|uniref:Uncharacterized protein n=2 Tax=Schistosoma haematobium TaxID=6185 RepID=A0A6A5DAJ7_SCHHA|nr:hypothetical protein MS3_00003674 [Schistosoma haematobium]KAH9591371.1 hypothetical protein MS3_00003674 [Schistosoma haematobium]
MGAKRPQRRRSSVSKASRKRNKAMIERSLDLLNNHALTFRNELKAHSESNKRDKDPCLQLENCTEQWQHHVSNAETRHRVFGHRDDNSIGVTILKHRLRWLGHVLRMSSQRIPRRALFADSGTGWKKRRGGQYMTWCRGMKESCKGLASIGSPRLLGWGPRDSATQWLETLSDMAENKSQWRSCCNLLLSS